MKSWKLQKKNNPKMWGGYIIVLGQSCDFLIVWLTICEYLQMGIP